MRIRRLLTPLLLRTAEVERQDGIGELTIHTAPNEVEHILYES